jgi:2-polyprenyl-6-methoxyphenol hydroxylase-like FAD-dependent oxidoreductase
MKILIVGAGIGGLTSALDLARAGHDVTLVEREARPSPLGAGIVLAPNAMRILRWLGVPLEAHGAPLAGLSVVSARGSLLSQMDAARFKDRYGEPWAFARPALHQALFAALPQRVQLRLGVPVQSLQVERDGVRVGFAEQHEPERFELVVGADGLRSEVRGLVVGAPRYRYSGTTCYRGLVENPGIERAIEAWGGAARIGVVPLAQGQLYYYLVLSAEARAPALPLAELRAAFAHIRGEVSQLWAALRDDPPLHHDLDELEAPVWGVARVLLLGDAAHGMTPNQGQGAAMAIEDALALTDALAPGADGALGRYAATRHARVLKVQLDSRRLGQLAHLPGPTLGFLRNGLLRLVPQSVADRQYVQLVEPGLALLERRAA